MRMNKSMIIIFILLIIGLIVRITVTDWGRDLIGDEIGYDRTAKQLITKGIFGYTPYAYSKEPNAYITPGYPFFVAFFYQIFGFSKTSSPLIPIQFVQIIMSVISAFLLYKIANKLYKDNKVSIIIMSLFLFHPTFIYSSAFMLSEVFYTFIFLLFIYLILKNIQDGFSVRNSILTGCIFSICVLIRPAILPFIIIFVVYLIYVSWKSDLIKVLYHLGIILLCFSMVMSFWVIRNYVSLERFVLLADQGGNPLLWGTYPFNANPNIDINQDPNEMKRIAVERIKIGLKNQPLRYVSWYTWGKSWYLIRDIWPGNNRAAHYPLTRFFHHSLAISGFVGMLLMIFNIRKRDLAVIALIGTVSFAVYLPFAPTSRYFYSVLPICFLGVGYLWITIKDLNKRQIVRYIRNCLDDYKIKV